MLCVEKKMRDGSWENEEYRALPKFIWPEMTEEILPASLPLIVDEIVHTYTKHIFLTRAAVFSFAKCRGSIEVSAL